MNTVNTDPISEVLSHFPNAKAAGQGKWMALCPAHEDRKPSLSISKGADGRVLLCCQAGCAIKDVLARVGMELKDLFFRDAKPSPKTARIIEKTYDYRDENGELKYQKVRYKGKEFTQRKPNGSGGWDYHLNGDRRLLYRLPELLNARESDPAGWIFYVEGEKAANALAERGLNATSAGGAAQWQDDFGDVLAGARVAVLSDNDPKGEAHAVCVGNSLSGKAAVVKVIKLGDLPEKGDVFDWLGMGGTAEMLKAIADSTPEYVPRENVTANEPAPDLNEERSAAEPWPEPLPLPNGLPAVMAFDYGLLPTSLHGWIEDIAQRMQCPPDFCAATVIIVAGSLIGRKVAIRPKRHDDWQVVVNLFGMNVGRPSLMKSPAMKEVMKPLDRLEIEAKEEYLKAMAEHEANAFLSDAKKKVGKAALHKAVKDGGDVKSLADELAKSDEDPPARQRYRMNDTTVEKLGLVLSENPNGVLIFQDEIISLLRTMDRDGHEGDRGFYLCAWAGDSRYTYDRIGRGTLDIEAAIVSIVGSIQPGIVADYLRAAVAGGHGDDGLLQRFQITVWPDAPATWRNVDRFPDTEAKNRAYVALQHLADFVPSDVLAERDNFDRDALPYLRFDPVAQQLFDDWRYDLENQLREGGEHPAIESHLAKYRSLIPSLALILHVLDGGVGPVTAEAASKAIAWGQYLESHARRLYASITEGPAISARLLASRIQSGDVADLFAGRNVYRMGWAGLDREQTGSAIDVLLSLHWLEERTEATAGRNKTCYAINPKIEISQNGVPTKSTKGPSVSSVSAGSRECADFAEDAR